MPLSSFQPPARTALAYAGSITLPLGLTVLAAQLALPAFAFEHLAVLVVVLVAIAGGWRPAAVAAVASAAADNLLLTAPVGRPAITGSRDVFDLALFLAVAFAVGWLVAGLQSARHAAEQAAQRERLAREERDHLVATVSHDLATPLDAIRATARFAQRTAAPSSDELRRLLTRIDRAALHATTIVDTLADAKSIAEHTFALRRAVVDVRTIVEPTVRMLDCLSDRHPLALRMPEGPVLIEGDADRLERVIGNLVHNAIKYSPEGGEVEIAVEAQAGVAVVSVADRGIGIEVADRDRLFTPGFRSPAAAALATGLGLGLYISSEIARRHGGRLEAEPRLPRGTVVSLRLPLAGTA